MYCASDTQTQESFVTACTSADNGQILVKNMIDQKVEIRDQKGVETSLCINYIKVSMTSNSCVGAHMASLLLCRLLLVQTKSWDAAAVLRKS